MTIYALGEIFEIARGGSPRPIDQFFTDDADGINWVLIGDATEGTKYIEKTKKRIKPSGVNRSRTVKPGDFLLTNSMSFGRPYIMKTSGCIHDGWLSLSPKMRNIDPNYFYYLLGSSTVYSEFERLAAGATVKNLNIGLVSGVRVPVPPLDEQRRIAAVLDQANAVRIRCERVHSHLTSLDLTIFTSLLRKVEASSAQSFRLGDVVDDVTVGHVGPTTEFFRLEGIPFLRTGNIGDDEMDLTDLKYVTEEFHKSHSKSSLRPGDILVSRVISDRVRASIVPKGLKSANCANAVVVRPGSRVSAEYLVRLIRSPSSQISFMQRQVGSAQLVVNTKTIHDWLVKVPSAKDQSSFVETITCISRAKSPFENGGFSRIEGRDSRLGCGPKRIAAGWPG